MTKIIITLPQTDVEHALYRTQEEWDQSWYSRANYDKRTHENEQRVRNQGHFGGSGGPLELAYREPERFPCLAIEAGLIRNSNGPDYMGYAFIYDIEIQEEMEDVQTSQA